MDPVRHEKSKYVWLYAGVSFFALAILGIWIFNVKTFIENSMLGGRDTTDLLQQGKQDFKKTIELINKSDNTGELLKEQQKADDAKSEKQSNEETKQQLQTIIYSLKKDGQQPATTTP